MTVITADILVFKKASQGHVWANEGVTRKKNKRKLTGRKGAREKKIGRRKENVTKRENKMKKKRNSTSQFRDKISEIVWDAKFKYNI